MYQLALPYRRNALILQRNLELREDSNLANIMLYHSVAEPGSDEKITPEHFHCPKRCDDDIDDGGGGLRGQRWRLFEAGCLWGYYFVPPPPLYIFYF